MLEVQEMHREVLEVMELLMKAQELQRAMQEVQELLTEVPDPLHVPTSCSCSAGLQQRAEPLEELSSTNCPWPNACRPCTAPPGPPPAPSPSAGQGRGQRAGVVQGWCRDVR